MKVYHEAYGCTMNMGEAEQMIDMLNAQGYEPTESPEDADLIVLATCIVIQTTEQRMINRLTELSKYGKEIIVTGCMASVFPDKIKEINEKARIVRAGDLSEIGGEWGEKLAFRRTAGIVPIAQGCTGHCTYCITKLARGEIHSYDERNLVRMAERYIRAGRKEIRITAQDTASYGMDTGTSLPVLVRRIAGLDGDFMIRIGMMSPRTLAPILDDMIDAYKDRKVFRFIHLPVQSGSDDILRKMNRGYTAEEYENMVGEIRKHLPDMTVSTDIIVGFPGETEGDFRKSLELVKRVEPDIVNVTRYSKRPGTPAAGMKQIPTQISKERSRKMSELRFEIAGKRNRMYVGKSLRVLALEKGKDEAIVGRAENYRQVVLTPNIRIGSWVKARITRSTGVDLRAEIIGPA